MLVLKIIQAASYVVLAGLFSAIGVNAFIHGEKSTGILAFLTAISFGVVAVLTAFFAGAA